MNRSRRQAGFAMMTTISIVFVVSVILAGVFSLVKQEMHAARRTRNYLKAKVIAEAGANAYYNQIKTNFTGFGLQPRVDFGGGDYQVTLTAVGTDRAHLLSLGRCGGSEALISLALRNFPRNLTSGGTEVRPPVLDNAMTSGGAMVLSGNVTVNGDVGSSASITAKGNSGQVTGNANAPSGNISDNHGMISGSTGSNPERYDIDWNSFLKLEDYIAHAVTWDGRDVSLYPPNTILYVDGSITISSSTTLRLCIIATGDIKVSGQATLLQPGTYPTLVSRDGSIQLSGGTSVEGLIAAMGPSGTLSTTGGGNQPVNIEGSVVCGGGFKDAGNWVLNHSEIELIPPGQQTSNDSTVIIAWQ